MTAGVGSAADRETEHRTGTLTFREGAVPPSIAVGDDGEPVRLIDLLTGGEVPLAKAQNGTAAGLVHLPQLPPGRFVLEQGDTTTVIEVREQEGTLLRYSIGGEEGRGGSVAVPVAIATLLVVTVAVAVTLRRRRALLLLAPGLLITVGLWSVTGTTTSESWSSAPWEACDQLDLPEQTLDCKVQSLLGRIDRQDYDGVATLLETTRDPACHDVAHRASYHAWRTGASLEQAQRLMIPGCDDGLIHGTVESMATFATEEDFVGLLVDFCGRAGENYKIQACLHGGGHATIWRTNGDLPAAWSLCDALPEDLLYEYRVRDECKGSAVMEWSDRWEIERDTGSDYLQPRIGEPMEICLSGPDTDLFQLGCYLGTNHRTGDAAAAAQWCSTLPEHVVQCYQALGENLPYFETPTTLTRLEPDMLVRHAASCLTAPDSAGVDACTTSMVRVYVLMTGYTGEESALCGLLPGEMLSACRQGFEQATFVNSSRGR